MTEKSDNMKEILEYLTFLIEFKINCDTWLGNSAQHVHKIIFVLVCNLALTSMH